MPLSRLDKPLSLCLCLGEADISFNLSVLNLLSSVFFLSSSVWLTRNAWIGVWSLLPALAGVLGDSCPEGGGGVSQTLSRSGLLLLRLGVAIRGILASSSFSPRFSFLILCSRILLASPRCTWASSFIFNWSSTQRQVGLQRRHGWSWSFHNPLPGVIFLTSLVIIGLCHVQLSSHCRC